MDEAGNLLAPGEIGEVVIRGANVTKGYENNPQANQAAFANGWFRTGDQGRFDADGYLFLTGRLKEIINRGGEKIAPREVDEVLTRHPAVAQAVTFPVPHPTLGEDVAAAIVLKPDACVTESELRDFAAVSLAEFKAPQRDPDCRSRYRRARPASCSASAWPTSSPMCWRASGRRTSLSAATGIEKEIAEIWRKLLKAERVGVRDDFNALGGDSLSMATMILQIEDRFKATVPIDQLPQIANGGDSGPAHSAGRGQAPRRCKWTRHRPAGPSRTAG